MFWRLHQPVRIFLRKVRQEQGLRHRRPRRVVYVTPQATVADAISTLVDYEIHRVYIVESHSNKTPIGLCSLRDVITQVITP